MGKRKKSSRKPMGPRRKEPLQTTFNCLFCNHEDAVTCKLDKKAGVGHLHCKSCGQQFQATINYLSHAVDVYSDWVDACDEVANPKAKSRGRAEERGRRDQERRDESPKYGGEGGGGGGEGGGDNGLGLDYDDDEDLPDPDELIGRRRRAAVDDDDDDDVSS